MQALKIMMNVFCLRKKVRERRSIAFPPNYTTNLGSTCTMSKERNWDKHRKWKFDKFGSLDYKIK